MNLVQVYVERYTDGIKAYPKNFKTTLKGIKAYRTINEGGLTSKTLVKTLQAHEAHVMMMDRVFKYQHDLVNFHKQEKKEPPVLVNTLEFIELLDKRLTTENITL